MFNKNIKAWVDFIKLKADTAKRLFNPNHLESYDKRVAKLKNKRDLLDLDNSSLKTLTPVLEDLKLFYAQLGMAEASGKYSPQELSRREVEKFNSLGENKQALLDYLRELETLMATQESYTGRRSEKMKIFPSITENVVSEQSENGTLSSS